MLDIKRIDIYIFRYFLGLWRSDGYHGSLPYWLNNIWYLFRQKIVKQLCIVSQIFIVYFHNLEKYWWNFLLSSFPWCQFRLFCNSFVTCIKWTKTLIIKSSLWKLLGILLSKIISSWGHGGRNNDIGWNISKKINNQFWSNLLLIQNVYNDKF